MQVAWGGGKSAVLSGYVIGRTGWVLQAGSSLVETEKVKRLCSQRKCLLVPGSWPLSPFLPCIYMHSLLPLAYSPVVWANRHPHDARLCTEVVGASLQGHAMGRCMSCHHGAYPACQLVASMLDNSSGPAKPTVCGGLPQAWHTGTAWWFMTFHRPLMASQCTGRLW